MLLKLFNSQNLGFDIDSPQKLFIVSQKINLMQPLF